MSDVIKAGDLRFSAQDEVRRYYTGDHEVQVSEGGEGALHSFYLGCSKNPEHTHFIPATRFTLHHLPLDYRDDDIYQTVKVLADLTVRVAVNFISLDRPSYYLDTMTPYPFYASRGMSTMRTGSGLVDNVMKFEGAPCPCRKCRSVSSTQPKMIYAEIQVFTAAHVIFDESEATATSLRLFYDEPGRDYVTLDDVSVWSSDITTDKCRLTCITHDKQLMNRLIDINERRKLLCRKVRDKYWSSREEDRLTIIASHPHGCQKQISVGEWRQRSRDNMYSMYTYSTATCPGSSGAYVYIVGSVGWWYEYVHKGANNEGTNFSSAGYDPDFHN